MNNDISIIYPFLINMKVLSFEDFVKKYNLKNDTMNESHLKKFIIIKYTPEIQKYIQIKDSFLWITEAWEEAHGLVL